MNNKILILGSNPETAPLVKQANRKGLTTFVIGMEKKSIAKDIAHYPIMGDASDAKLVKKILEQNNIKALMIGTVDVLLNTYEKVCREKKLPCFVNKKAITAFSNKKNFNKVCKKFGFNQIPDYTSYLTRNNNKLSNDKFPVLVKPVDSGGGVGAKVCYSNDELKKAVINAKKLSKSNSFICQDFFLEDDIQIYYTIINKKIYLSSVIDRTTNKNQKNKSPVCIGTNYRSKYLNLILKNYNQNFKKMINYLNLKNGILSIQCFVRENQIYPYDPGLRLQGEGQHLVLNKINNFDHLDMLLNLSIGKPFFRGNFKKYNDPNLKNKFVSSVWVLLKKGVINKIFNLSIIKKHKCFIEILQRFKSKDRIHPNFIGTEKQVFARIYLGAKSKKELRNAINFVHKKLRIEDNQNKDLILDKFNI